MVLHSFNGNVAVSKEAQCTATGVSLSACILCIFTAGFFPMISKVEHKYDCYKLSFVICKYLRARCSIK